MNTSTKRAGAVASAVVAVGIVVGGVWGIGSAVAQPSPEPTETPAVEIASIPADAPNGNAAEQEAEAAAAEAERVAAEAAAAEAARVEAERVAAVAAAAEAERSAPAAPAAPTPAPTQPAAPAPAPAAPILCPAGSSANSSDGYNDTSCMWEVCFTIALPDPTHPECDATFRP